MKYIILPIIILISGCGNNSEVFLKGNMSHENGSPTLRTENTPYLEDNPYTTNNESNDQPIGYYGSMTVNACNNKGKCYILDADISDNEVERLYFPKGGWIDINYSDCKDNYCSLEDENGNEWEVEF